MKRYFFLILVVCLSASVFSQKNGDSLAILYYRVYAYENPDDLSTRLSVKPFSYRDKDKLVFLEDSKEYPGYFKVKTPKGITTHVKSNRLSVDQSLSHKQIKNEIEEGKRFKFYGVKYKVDGFDFPLWYYAIGFVILLIIAFIFYKKYVVFDRWFCNKAESRSKPINKPWFIKYALFPGLVVGGFQLLAPKEFTWFMAEGVQVWGSYPSFWDWILWVTMMSIVVVYLFAFIQAFQRFSFKYGLIYSAISLIVISIYFFIGGITGGFVTVILMASGGGDSKNKSGGSGNSESSRGPNSSDTQPTGSFKYIKGERHIKNTGGTYDKH